MVFEKQAHFPQEKLGTARTKEAKMATDEILVWVREQRKQDGRRPNACGRQRTRPNYTILFLTGVLNPEKCNTNTSTRREREVSPTAPCYVLSRWNEATVIVLKGGHREEQSYPREAYSRLPLPATLVREGRNRHATYHDSYITTPPKLLIHRRPENDSLTHQKNPDQRQTNKHKGRT